MYERDGQYQLYAKEMQPDGIGSLYLAYEQLKERLEKEGLFSPERKKAIPAYPRTIGVITSPTGAAVRDIITTIKRRYPAGHILLFPVAVQGEYAPPGISRAIRQLNERGEVDVIIVGRGGGSIEELWAFNEESVARSIFDSAIPVISAVGHETDFTIADFVADMRAATPTAAAEIAVPNILELKERIQGLSGRLSTSLRYQVRHMRQRLEKIQRSYIFRQPGRQIVQYEQQLDRLQERLNKAGIQYNRQKRSEWNELHQSLLRHNPGLQVERAQNSVLQQTERLKRAMETALHTASEQLDRKLAKLDALSPLKVMHRGYSLVFKDGIQERQLVKSVNDVNPGDPIKVQLRNGTLDCQVWGIEGEKIDGQEKE